MNIEELNSKKFTRNNEIVGTWIDDELVMMSMESGKYYTLNRTASLIWDALNESKTFEQIVSFLHSKYDVADEVCRNEVASYIQTICEKNLILETADN